MELQEVRYIVRDAFWDWEREHLDDKECPKCKALCTMVKVVVTPNDPKADCEDKWRCLNCLGLFTEGLKGIE